jgi:hypothetical protein
MRSASIGGYVREQDDADGALGVNGRAEARVNAAIIVFLVGTPTSQSSEEATGATSAEEMHNNRLCRLVNRLNVFNYSRGLECGRGTI